MAFQIDVTAFEAPGKVVVELLDASSQVVRQERAMLEPGRQEFVFRVASSSLEVGRTYQLVARAAGASPDEAALIEMVFTPVFED